MVASKPENPAGDPTAIAMRVDRIDSITQIQGTFAIDADRMPGEGDPLMPVNGLSVAEASQSDDRIGVILGYSFAAHLAGDDHAAIERDGQDPVFSASGQFLVIYQLDSAEAASEPDLKAFAEVNGRLNTVPYWREFLHNALTRAGLPAYEVPPFNPVKIARFLSGPETQGMDDH